MATKVVATAFGGPDVLSVVEADVPEPGPGEVVVAVKAAGINLFDYKIISGMLGADPDRLPLPVGLEVAGVVTAAGSDAVGPAGPIAVGDEVVAYPVDGG
jgi:NADPH2:quinone reductase